jgi:hypothetical protein
MRHILFAAALAVGGIIASGPAFAQQVAPPYEPASPNHVGAWCKVVTSHGTLGNDFYGYYQQCVNASMAYAPIPQRHW